jgi:hypothetical protein
LRLESIALLPSRQTVGYVHRKRTKEADDRLIKERGRASPSGAPEGLARQEPGRFLLAGKDIVATGDSD